MSRTKHYIERIRKDVSLKKNESNLRLQYNPLLDELLEMKEREAELAAAAMKRRQEVADRLKSLSKEMAKKERLERRFQTLRQDDPNKISIMKSSLSRERVESLENKFRKDLKGPGHYQPNFLFGKKQAQGISFTREARDKLYFPPTLQTHLSQASINSLDKGVDPPSITPVSNVKP